MKIEWMLKVLQVAMLIAEAAFMAVLVFPWLGQRLQKNYIGFWSRRVLRVFGLTVVLKNPNNHPAQGGYCLVANHVSWIDIQVIHSVVPCRFVTTTEIQGWPIIGRMVRASGALFIDLARIRSSTQQITRDMASLLRKNEVIGFFPEATSTDGVSMLPFKANLFQAAVDTQTSVYPMTLVYKDLQGQRSVAPGFHGEMTLFECMANILRAAPLTVEVGFLPAVMPQAHRRGMSQACESAIRPIVEAPDPQSLSV